MDNLSIVGNISSIASLALTIWVVIEVRRVHKHFLFLGRFQSLQKTIGQYSREISGLLNSTVLSKLEVETILTRCLSTLNSLSDAASGRPKKTTKALSKSILKAIASGKTADKSIVQDLYYKLITLETDLCNFKEDLKWKPPR